MTLDQVRYHQVRLGMLGIFFMLLFFKTAGIFFQDPDKDRYSVGSDLGPNCLQRLSADNILLSLAVRVLAFSLHSLKTLLDTK